MILCFDVGNTDIFGGVMDGGRLLFEFRRGNEYRPSADELGVFILQLLKAKGVPPESIKEAAIASVVPGCNDILMTACERYLGLSPLLLQAGVKTGLKLRVPNPNEVGADRIANAIAAVDRFPDRPLIVIDLGTATTFCAVTADREYHGGVIAAGVQLSMQALAQRTAKLPSVDLVTPGECLARTTVTAIQSGLFYGHLGLIKEVIQRLEEEVFAGERAMVIGTGGNARFFRDEGVFDVLVPDLVFHGLVQAVKLNRNLRKSLTL